MANTAETSLKSKYYYTLLKRIFYFTRKIRRVIFSCAQNKKLDRALQSEPGDTRCNFHTLH